MSSGYQWHWEAQGVDKYTPALTNTLVPVGRPVTSKTDESQRREVRARSHLSLVWITKWIHYSILSTHSFSWWFGGIHRLTNVNMDAKTITCSVCLLGIHLSRMHEEQLPASWFNENEDPCWANVSLTRLKNKSYLQTVSVWTQRSAVREDHFILIVIT